jgi:phospholipase C
MTARTGINCTSTRRNKNIGDLLNAKNVTWGYFEGGFKPTSTKQDSTAVCGASHNVGAMLGGTGKSGRLPLGTKDDYIPHQRAVPVLPSSRVLDA